MRTIFIFPYEYFRAEKLKNEDKKQSCDAIKKNLEIKNRRNFLAEGKFDRKEI